jgi:putative transcriptional regulator
MERYRVHNTVRDHRKRAGGWTQQELADRVGVTRQSIVAIERGTHRPGIELALRLARVFGCRVEDLFALRD